MKVALVHDYLNQYGGAERILETFIELFPEAPIYTLFYDEDMLGGRFAGKDIRTSFLDNKLVRQNHRFFIPFMPKAAESIDLGDKYDLIISDSAGWAKGIKYRDALHINYLHCPLRYAWEPEKYLSTLIPKSLISLSKPIIKYLRHWDRKTGQKPDIIFSPSNYTADKVNRFYGRETEVLYPPIDLDKFYYDPPERETEEYFLTFGRLVHQKRFDLLIKAFNKLGLPLKIAGSGLDKDEIMAMISSPKIEILNWVEDGELRKLISGAKATIFGQVEDFGMVAGESIACGTPVIALSEGGFGEIIEDGENGVLFDEQNEDGLIKAIHRLSSLKFDRKKIINSADKFSKKNFIKTLKNRISEAIKG